MSALLEPGDWVVGHSCKATGRRLVYAMRLTKVLDMDEYFRDFPDKRPAPLGSREQQSGDNMYYRESGRWVRLPSAEHNTVASFRQDQGRRVYLAEGADHYWYFGATSPMSALHGFADFRWLIQDRQGCEYVRDTERIAIFAKWLESLGQRGRIGSPRDRVNVDAERYLVAIDPVPDWREFHSGTLRDRATMTRSTDISAPQPRCGRGCGTR